MADFYIKVNDRLPVILATLSDAAGPINLTGATVKFIMTDVRGTTPKVNAAAAIDPDPTTGKVSYVWVTGDTDTPGVYDAEWEIIFGDGKPLTVPNDGRLRVQVVRDLA